jgi:hypothetical protein
MQEYEVRILRVPGSPALITSEIQMSDGAAIRHARKLAEGKPFEVWRGLECIVQSDKPIAGSRPRAFG